MDNLLYVVLFFLGLFGSFFSGMLGIGGAIIHYPLLFYIPVILGVGSFTAQEVSGISMFQVLFASLAGTLAFYRQRKSDPSTVIHRGLVFVMGGSILLGSLFGAAVSGYLPQHWIHFVYGGLATIAAVLMLLPVKGSQEQQSDGTAITFNKSIAAISSFVVGVISGIVGAGGAFILIPIMLTVLKIPTRVTIASSLMIVLISAIGGAIGKLTTGQLLVGPTVFAVLGSMIGAPLGSILSRRMSVVALRYALVSLIIFTATKIWLELF